MPQALVIRNPSWLIGWDDQKHHIAAGFGAAKAGGSGAESQFEEA